MALGGALSLLQWYGMGRANLPLGMLLVVPELILFSLAFADMKAAPGLLRAAAPYAGKAPMVVYLIHVLYLKMSVTYHTTSAFWSRLYEGYAHIPHAVWILALSLLTGAAFCLLSALARAVGKKPDKT